MLAGPPHDRIDVLHAKIIIPGHPHNTTLASTSVYVEVRENLSSFHPMDSLPVETNTDFDTHTHTQKYRERKRGREGGREEESEREIERVRESESGREMKYCFIMGCTVNFS